MVDHKTDDGGTAVYICAQENHFECLKILLGAGANPNIITEEPRSLPLLVALKTESKQ